jgi:hypothetical protein
MRSTCGVRIHLSVDRYTRACGSYNDFLDICLLLTSKLLNQGFLVINLKSSPSKVLRSPPWSGLTLQNICVTNDNGSEVVNRRRADNRIDKGKRTNGQKMIYETLHKKTSNTNPTKTGGECRCCGIVGSSCSTCDSRRVTVVTTPDGDDFNFPIVNFPFICSNISAAPVAYTSLSWSIYQSLWFI